jgi:hypothetical protein
VEKLLRRLLGVDAKLRQYAEGRRFVHEVHARVGMAGFNRVWDSPLTLPLLHELTDADAWIARVGATPTMDTPAVDESIVDEERAEGEGMPPAPDEPPD